MPLRLSPSQDRFIDRQEQQIEGQQPLRVPPVIAESRNHAKVMAQGFRPAGGDQPFGKRFRNHKAVGDFIHCFEQRDAGQVFPEAPVQQTPALGGLSAQTINKNIRVNKEKTTVGNTRQRLGSHPQAWSSASGSSATHFHWPGVSFIGTSSSSARSARDTRSAFPSAENRSRMSSSREGAGLPVLLFMLIAPRF